MDLQWSVNIGGDGLGVGRDIVSEGSSVYVAGRMKGNVAFGSDVSLSTGFVFWASAGSMSEDGETFPLSDQAGTSVTFEMVKDGGSASGAGHVAIPFTSPESDGVIAAKITSAINENADLSGVSAWHGGDHTPERPGSL